MSFEKKNLGEICDFQGGSQPPKSAFVYEPKEGYIRFLQIRDFGSEKNHTYIPISKKNKTCSADDIMIGRYGASVGKILRGRGGAYNVALMKATPVVNLINKHFFWYYLNSAIFQDDLRSVASRSAQNGFSKDDIFNFKVPLPPLATQQKIVAKLDAVFAEIDKATAAAEANAKNAEALFQSYLTEIFERGGEGWNTDKLEKFVDIKHGFAFDGEDFEQSDNEQLPIVLTPGNFTEDGKLYFSTKNTKRINKIEKISNKFSVGDLVIVMTDLSSKMKILGKPAIIDREEILHNQRIGLFQFKNNDVNKNFLYFFLKTRKYIEAIKATSTGSMVRHTAPKRILATNINYPNINNQIQLVSKFEELSKKTSNVASFHKSKIQELNLLKQSILKQAFNGELVKE